MQPKEKRKLKSLTNFIKGEKPKTLGNLLSDLPIADLVEKPDHEWNGTSLKFENPDGEWGQEIDLKGEKGDKPVYGIDYLTDSEKNKIIHDITPVKGIDYNDGVDGYTPVKGVDYNDGKDGKNGETPSVDYKKIEQEVVTKVLPLIPNGKDGKDLDPKIVVEKIKQLKGNDRIPLSAIKDSEFLRKKGDANGGFNMNDQRWHGGGLSKVTTDATLTGEGTPASPLGAIAIGSDEKVKYDAADPTAGYVADKFVAGTGISVAEGTGADENKLKITNSAPDQTVSLTPGTNITSITGSYPNFTINAATQGGGIPWSAVTSNGTLVVDTGTLANKGTLLSLALPGTSAVGKVVRVAGMNAGLWTITQAANQYIKFGNQSTTIGVAGSVSSVLAYDAVELVCIETDLGWVVVSSIGNITIV